MQRHVRAILQLLSHPEALSAPTAEPMAQIQAPIIMMSQNRMEARDRLRSENDYQVNLKAELEIRHSHAKLDVMLKHQWQELLEIRQIQMDFMKELVRNESKG